MAPFSPGVITYHFMEISDVYLGLGQEGFARLVRGISIGKLRTYQIYEGFKVRAHLSKVNTEALRKAVPRFWERISAQGRGFRQGSRSGRARLASRSDRGGARFPRRAPRQRVLRQGYRPQALFHRRLGRPGLRKLSREISRIHSSLLYQSPAMGIAGCNRGFQTCFSHCGLDSAGRVQYMCKIMTVPSRTRLSENPTLPVRLWNSFYPNEMLHRSRNPRAPCMLVNCRVFMHRDTPMRDIAHPGCIAPGTPIAEQARYRT